MIPTILIQQEVVELLKCSVSKVKQLRNSGRLAYLPGRPVKFLKADVQQYLDEERRRKEARAEARKPRPLTAAELQEYARIWALNAVFTDMIRRQARAERKASIK